MQNIFKLLIEAGMSERAVPLVPGPQYHDKPLDEPLDESDVPVYWYNWVSRRVVCLVEEMRSR